MYDEPDEDMMDQFARDPLDYTENSSNDDDEFLPGERPQQLGGNVPEDELMEQQRVSSINSSSGKSKSTEENGEEEEEEEALEPTPLGDAIDSLMMHWCQLLTNVSVKPPIPPPPTLDHVKEVAEVCSKHFRDATVDVSNEFARLGIQWELEDAQEQFLLENDNLDEAIERQERLIDNAKEMLAQRISAYTTQFPEAGKHFTT